MITIEQAKIYRSPLTGRRYFTKQAAIKATARKLILLRHPTEREDYTDGYCTDPGFHWTSLPRADVLYRRVERLVKKGEMSDIE